MNMTFLKRTISSMIVLILLLVILTAPVNATGEITIIAHAIVCENENLLPNWGINRHNIDGTTAQTFVDTTEGCDFAANWQFEWKLLEAGMTNPYDNRAHVPDWTISNPTNVYGRTLMVVQNPTTQVWIRQVMKGDYLPFSSTGGWSTSAELDDVSAEFYCQTDVMNYDNYEGLINQEAGEIYHCIGFNVPEGQPEPEPECTLDTDSGANKGTKGQVYNNERLLGTDFCIGDYHLQEFICVNEEYAEYVYDCSEYGMICDNGACVTPEPEPECADIPGYDDGGRNHGTKGTICIKDCDLNPNPYLPNIWDSSYFGTDYCVSGTVLHEYNCEEGKIVDYDYNCGPDRICQAGACVDPEPKEPITIIAHKVVCDYETSLPNWGFFGPDITSTTAQDFVNANSDDCWLEEDWKFQWGFQGEVTNPGNNVGEVNGGNWHTFGPTNRYGMTSVEIDFEENNKIWVREAFQDRYVTFTGTQLGSRSAEMYCHDDVGVYDNYDFINPLEEGETYYCIAFNAIEYEQPIYECSDGIDNDNDGLIDYPNDPGCESTEDDDEYNDPIIVYQCSDGLDNDGDGLIDFPSDPGCDSLTDDDEYNYVHVPECRDGIDNDNDGLIDYPNDPGCESTEDDDEYNDPIIVYQCSDGIDNDGDGLIDFPSDPGCDSLTDDDEYNYVHVPECRDGIDNDNNGYIDYPRDKGCDGPNDETEFTEDDDGNDLALKITKVDIFGYDYYGVLSGEEMLVSITFENIGNKKINNLVVGAMFPELGIDQRFSIIDINAGKRKTVQSYMYIPEDVDPDEYYLNIYASNKDLRKTKYVPVMIKDS
ncbi:MAG: hypothetical protein ABIB43_03115 [archaeon]